MAERRRPGVRAGLLIAAGVLIAGGLLLRWSAPAPDAASVAAVGATPLEVATLRVAPEPVQRRVTLAGVLEARRSVDLFAETRGRVIALGAEELDPVEADTAIVELDPLLARVAVERAQAGLDRSESQRALARSHLARRRSLAERDVASAAALDDAENAARIAEAQVREARAALAEARDELDKKTLEAPFAGVLRSLPIEVGEYVQEGQPVAELLDLSTARLTLGVTDREVVDVRPGDPVSVRVEALPGRRFQGEILRVGSAAGVESKKFPVEVELANPDGTLLPGMIARAVLDVGEPEPLALIPMESAPEEFGLHFVYVVERRDGDGNGHVARRRRVQVREVPFRPGEFEVVEGLAAGEMIAVTGVRQLRDGRAVRPAGGVDS